MTQQERILKRAKWQEIIEAYTKSGLSQKEFCRQHQLVLSQFSYYHGLIKTNKENKPEATDNFVAVKFNKNEISICSEIRLILPNGFQCFLPVHLDAIQIKQLISVLLSC